MGNFDENILLSIRREFSKNEKYRLFLKHLDNVESQLREERKRHTQLISEHAARRKELKMLREQLQAVQLELGEYKATESDKKFVRMKAYKKLEATKTMWETMFWEKHKQLQDLKNSLDETTETKQDAGLSPAQEQAK